jgi:hypothetical protein
MIFPIPSPRVNINSSPSSAKYESVILQFENFEIVYKPTPAAFVMTVPAAQVVKLIPWN